MRIATAEDFRRLKREREARGEIRIVSSGEAEERAKIERAFGMRRDPKVDRKCAELFVKILRVILIDLPTPTNSIH